MSRWNSLSLTQCLREPPQHKVLHFHLESPACRDVERRLQWHDERPLLEADDSPIDSASGAGYATHLQYPQRVSHALGETEPGVNIGMLSDVHVEPQALSSYVGSSEIARRRVP